MSDLMRFIAVICCVPSVIVLVVVFAVMKISSMNSMDEDTRSMIWRDWDKLD